MMNLDDYMEVAGAKDLPTLEKRLVRFANQLDFGIISGALVIEVGAGSVDAFRLGNTPQAFEANFVSKTIGQRDPVLRRLKHGSAPFLYDQNLYVNESAADIWEMQAPFGYKTGIATPLHLPKGMHFMLGVDRERPLPNDSSTITRMAADLQLLAVHAVDIAVQLLTVDSSNDKGRSESDVCPLSRREVEALQWTLDGKTAWEVGAILAISEGTAAQHLSSATRKLGAANKCQAAATALRRGWIR